MVCSVGIYIEYFTIISYGISINTYIAELLCPHALIIPHQSSFGPLTFRPWHSLKEIHEIVIEVFKVEIAIFDLPLVET